MIQVLLDKPADSHAVDMAQLNYEIEQAGGASTYYYEQGVDAYEAGSYEEAIAANEHALTYGAPSEPAWRLTGLSFIRLGDFEAAIAALENGIALDPANAELSRNLLPRALLAAGQTESARRILEQRLSDDPTHFDSVLTLSTLHQSQGDTAAAVRVLAATLNEHPEETYLHLQLGKILLATGKHEQARTHLRTAVPAGPPGAQSQVYASSNRIRSEAEFYLAHLCRLQGDPEAFLRHLENATELDPSHLEASQALQEAQSR
jgi:tetratricopeptide (TPR) repeat protein